MSYKIPHSMTPRFMFSLYSLCAVQHCNAGRTQYIQASLLANFKNYCVLHLPQKTVPMKPGFRKIVCRLSCSISRCATTAKKSFGN